MKLWRREPKAPAFTAAELHEAQERWAQMEAAAERRSTLNHIAAQAQRVVDEEWRQAELQRAISQERRRRFADGAR